MRACPICGWEPTTSTAVMDFRFMHCPACGHGVNLTYQPPDYQRHAVFESMPHTRVADQLAFLDADLPTNARVLELGAADGSFARGLRAKASPLHYAALEPAPVVIDGVDQRFKRWEAVEGTYDLLVASHVLEHLVDVHVALRAMSAFLEPSGVLFLEVPHGSGHPALPFDTNPGHRHHFTSESLSWLLARHGFKVTRQQTGAYESLRYPDSIRVIARRAHISPTDPSHAWPTPEWTGDELGRLLPKDHPPLVIWGAGGITRELLSPFVSSGRIAWFVDRNPALHKQTLAGKAIKPADALNRGGPYSVLIGTIDHEDSVRADLRAYDQVTAVFAVSDLLRQGC